jgi:hypothetical protein
LVLRSVYGRRIKKVVRVTSGSGGGFLIACWFRFGFMFI